MLPNINPGRRIENESAVKKKYTEAIPVRYKNASRHEKSIILDEFCATRGYHRKHAIRILKIFKRVTKQKAKKRKKTSVYQNNEIFSNPASHFSTIPSPLFY
jgi:hypothetical protein